MLSPIAEMEQGGPVVRDLGFRSLTLWQEIDDALSGALGQPFDARDHHGRDHADHHDELEETYDSPLGLQLNDSLIVCHANDLGAAQRILQHLDQDPSRFASLTGPEVAPLAPGLKGTLHAWRLIGEGHLFPTQAMESLFRGAQGVDWRWSTPIIRLGTNTIETAEGRQAFDWVIDTRGVGASSDISVRGVRGELLVLFAPGFELHRPVRLVHPRWRVYIVPRPGRQIVIGATEIESEDRSPISVQSTMELLSSAFSIFPSLAEARILWTDVNLRPAMMDNLPFVETQPGLTRINGLFRHGWLLAPAVIEQALRDADLS
jgi:glycine oxidase